MLELVEGSLEVLPMPTWLHQLMVKFLVRAIEVASAGVGEVLAEPLPIRLFENNIREPDVMYFATGSESKDPRGYQTRVDLAIEVVSERAEAATYRLHGEFTAGQTASGVLLPALEIEV